ALGRICAAEELWGKAEEFLLRAERRDPDAQTRTLLAQLCERLDRDEDAARWYREAALAAFGDESVRLTPERLPATVDETLDDADAPRALPIPGP
ncbi:MAG: hypothetical protein GX644_05135, partial [Limnobacter sp.]|nr:hypothetical protein [Limnobacter sp.]